MNSFILFLLSKSSIILLLFLLILVLFNTLLSIIHVGIFDEDICCFLLFVLEQEFLYLLVYDPIDVTVKVVLEPPPGSEQSIFFEGGWLYFDQAFCKVGTFVKIFYSKIQGTYLAKISMKKGGGIILTIFKIEIFKILRGGGSISTVVLIQPLR